MPLLDSSFCLNDCRFGGYFDLVLFSSGVTLIFFISSLS